MAFDNPMMVLKRAYLKKKYFQKQIQIPTRIPEKVVVALFSGILVISGIVVVAGRQLTNYQVSQARFCALRDFLLVSEMLDSKRCKLRRPLKGTKSVQSHLALKELN